MKNPLIKLLLLAALAVSLHAQDITTGLVARWQCNEGSGTTCADSSGNSNTLTTTGTQTWGAGIVGSSSLFFGNSLSQYATAASQPCSALPCAVGLWMRASSPPSGSDDYILSIALSSSTTVHYSIGVKQTTGYAFFTTRPDAGSSNIDVITTVNVADNVPHHILVVWNTATDRRIYIDGALAGAGTASKAYVSSNRLRVGQIAGSSAANAYGGRVDDIYVFQGRNFIDADAQALYLAGGVDNVPPVRFAGSPSYYVADATTSVAMTLTTSENATCKYGTVAATAYDSIANTFSTTGTSSHSQTLSVSSGNTYTYYVRCRDAAADLNTNTDDYTITFSVDSAALRAARTRYIDFAGGSDSNDGLTTATAWKRSPGDASATGNAAAYALTPGAFLNFRGCVNYKGSITVPASGTNEYNRIVFDGNSSRDWGGCRAAINNENDNALTVAFAVGSRSWITIKGFEVRDIGGYANDTDPSAANGYTCTGTPVPAKNGSVVTMSGASRINLLDLVIAEIGEWHDWPAVRGVVSSAIDGTAISINNSSNIFLDQIDLTRVSTPIRVRTQSGGTTRDVEIARVNIHNYIRWGIDITAGNNNETLQNITVRDSDIHDYNEYARGNWGGCLDGPDAFEEPHTDGIFVRNTNVTGTTWSGIKIFRNRFYDSAASSVGGGTATIYFSQGASGDVYNNIFWLYLQNQGVYIDYAGPSGVTAQVVNVVGNTFYSRRGAILSGSQVGAGSTQRVLGNIFNHVNASDLSYPVEFQNTAPSAWDYNLYLVSSPSQRVARYLGNYRTLSALRSSNGFETSTSFGNSVNPLFINASTGDFRLQSSSPAIDAGTDLSAYFTSDYLGVTRPKGSGWDIGAYEYDPSASYTISGNISGLAGTVVLRNNGGDNLSRSSNGSFTFATPVANGGAYSVSVFAQPSGQTCSVSNGSGTVAGANVTNIAVNCVASGVSSGIWVTPTWSTRPFTASVWRGTFQ